MNLPAFVRVQPDGEVVLSIKVQPRASRNEICEVVGNELKIRITAPPVDSAANEALVRFLAEKLECAGSSVRLIRGATSRHKTIGIRGIDPATVVQRLTNDESERPRSTPS